MASMILIIAVASALLVLGPSINSQAQLYNDRNEYSTDYNNAYSHDDKNSKKSSDVNIQKIKCVNSNLNVNGIDISEIPQSPPVWDESGPEGVTQGVNTQQNDNTPSDSLNVQRNLVDVCANVNSNDQLNVEPQEPATLTVNKQVFGCATSTTDLMNCQVLQDGSASWLPCIGSSISGTSFCQGLPENLFDIDVLDDQNTQIQQFEGSTAGTTIQNLRPGTYTVNEIKHASNFDQLGQDPTAQQACTTTAGFDDGGILLNNNADIFYAICFEYEDEQGNDCSTVALAAGEHKICTVKNYIRNANVE